MNLIPDIFYYVKFWRNININNVYLIVFTNMHTVCFFIEVPIQRLRNDYSYFFIFFCIPFSPFFLASAIKRNYFDHYPQYFSSLFRHTNCLYPRYCTGYIAMGKWISLFVMVSFSRFSGTLVRQLCLSLVHEFGAWRIYLLSIITIRYARYLDKSEFWYVQKLSLL